MLLLKRRPDFAGDVLDYLAEFCQLTDDDVDHATAVWVNTGADEEELHPDQWLPRVKYVLTNTTDTSHVDAFCDARGIRPISLQDENLRSELEEITATADYTEILIRLALRAVDRDDPPGKEICRAKVGLLVEYASRPGRIARRLNGILEGLGALTVFLEPSSWIPDNIDCLSVHLRAIPRYHSVLCAELFDRLPSGTALVNTSRGNLVNRHDLVCALESGRIRRYVADFPGPSHRRILTTPHVAGREVVAVRRTQWMIARRFRDALRYLPPDPPGLS